MSAPTTTATTTAAAAEEAAQQQEKCSREKLFEQQLENQVPKIDAALKSFASYMSAKGQATATTINVTPGTQPTFKTITPLSFSLPEILSMIRCMSKTINAYRFNIENENNEAVEGNAVERTLTAQVWNSVDVAAGDGSVATTTTAAATTTVAEKPTKRFGRKALQMAWKNLKFDLSTGNNCSNDEERTELQEKFEWFLNQFERILFADNHCSQEILADQHLVWDADGGHAELARRAAERKQRADRELERQTQGDSKPNQLPTIEEIQE